MRPGAPKSPRGRLGAFLRIALAGATMAGALLFTRERHENQPAQEEVPMPQPRIAALEPDVPQTEPDMRSARTEPPAARPDAAVPRLSLPALPDAPALRKPLPDRLVESGFAAGDPVFIRIFKESSELELWMKDVSGWRLFDTWPVCRWSGTLGPKLKEGDGQSPEGFYTVTKGALNPNSNYHLSFNLGFPNAYDRALGRTGSFLMVHGNCLSIGCYAMTDAGIDDIYGLVEAALDGGQREVPVHIFPFRMTDEAMGNHGNSEWADFWRNLKTGHDMFEETRTPPIAAACGKSYVFAAKGRPQCAEQSG
jgi:murein L,D-transpeptidase YafK